MRNQNFFRAQNVAPHTGEDMPIIPLIPGGYWGEEIPEVSKQVAKPDTHHTEIISRLSIESHDRVSGGGIIHFRDDYDISDAFGQPDEDRTRRHGRIIDLVVTLFLIGALIVIALNYPPVRPKPVERVGLIEKGGE